MPGRTRRRGIRGFAALIAAASLAGCGGEEQADLLVTAPRLFDGRALIRDGAVAIKGDAIVAVGKRNHVDVDAKRTIRLVVRRGAIQVGGWRLDSMPWRRPRQAPGGAS